MGAGVATVLAMLLKKEYPGLEAFAYAPPGATLSRPLASAVDSFITSVVLGKDMVPRMSLPTIYALLGDMIDYSSRARVNKSSLLRRTFCCCLRTPTQDAVLHAEDDRPNAPLSDKYAEVKNQMAARLRLASQKAAEQEQAAMAGVTANAEGLEPAGESKADASADETKADAPSPAAPANPPPVTTSSTDHIKIAITPKMPDAPELDIIQAYRIMSAPGKRILHFIKQASHVTCLCSRREYLAVWSPTESFQEILVSHLMVHDHLPNRLLNVMNKYMEEAHL